MPWVGGEPMPLPLIKAWHEKGVPVRQGYGLTEFGPNVFSLNEEDAVRKNRLHRIPQLLH